MDVSVLVLMIVVLSLETNTLAAHYFFSSAILSWSEANAYCSIRNGSLILFDSEDNWEDYEGEMNYRDKCDTRVWTSNQLGSCLKWLRMWSYSGWAQWNGFAEPNDCPNSACVSATCSGMKTRSCEDTYIALCEDDIATVTNRTYTSEGSSTGQTTALTGVTTDARTTTEDTSTSIGTTEIATRSKSTLINLLTAHVKAMENHIPANDVNGSCCNCPRKNNTRQQLSQEELTASIQELKEKLAVNKTNLSATRRKLVSVYDSQPSSVAAGGVAVTFLAVIIGMIIFPDVINMIRYLL